MICSELSFEQPDTSNDVKNFRNCWYIVPMMFPSYGDINTLVQIPLLNPYHPESILKMCIKKYRVKVTKFDRMLYKSNRGSHIKYIFFREKHQILCVCIYFYCNKATCILLTLKTEHRHFFTVKQKEN